MGELIVQGGGRLSGETIVRDSFTIHLETIIVLAWQPVRIFFLCMF